MLYVLIYLVIRSVMTVMSYVLCKVIAASGGIISISGSNLMIKSIDEDEITISGKINMIEFI